MFKHLIAGSFI